MAYERPTLQVKFNDGSFSKPFYNTAGLARALKNRLADTEIVCQKTGKSLPLPSISVSKKNLQLQLFTLLNPTWNPAIMSKGAKALLLLEKHSNIKDSEWAGKWGAHVWKLLTYGFIVHAGGYNHCWRITSKGQNLLREMKTLPQEKYRVRTCDLASELRALFLTPTASVYDRDNQVFTLHQRVRKLAFLEWQALGLLTIPSTGIAELTDKGKGLIQRKLDKLVDYLIKKGWHKDLLSVIAPLVPKNQIGIFIAKFPEFSHLFTNPTPISPSLPINSSMLASELNFQITIASKPL